MHSCNNGPGHFLATRCVGRDAGRTRALPLRARYAALARPALAHAAVAFSVELCELQCERQRGHQ